MKKYIFNNFSWNYDTVINVDYKNLNNLIIIHDHEKILDNIDKNLESSNNFQDALNVIDQIKNNRK